jgi:hypothetical protein
MLFRDAAATVIESEFAPENTSKECTLNLPSSSDCEFLLQQFGCHWRTGKAFFIFCMLGIRMRMMSCARDECKKKHYCDTMFCCFDSQMIIMLPQSGRDGWITYQLRATLRCCAKAHPRHAMKTRRRIVCLFLRYQTCKCEQYFDRNAWNS